MAVAPSRRRKDGVRVKHVISPRHTKASKKATDKFAHFLQNLDEDLFGLPRTTFDTWLKGPFATKEKYLIKYICNMRQLKSMKKYPVLFITDPHTLDVIGDDADETFYGFESFQTMGGTLFGSLNRTEEIWIADHVSNSSDGANPMTRMNGPILIDVDKAHCRALGQMYTDCLKVIADTRGTGTKRKQDNIMSASLFAKVRKTVIDKYHFNQEWRTPKHLLIAVFFAIAPYVCRRGKDEWHAMKQTDISFGMSAEQRKYFRVSFTFGVKNQKNPKKMSEPVTVYKTTGHRCPYVWLRFYLKKLKPTKVEDNALWAYPNKDWGLNGEDGFRNKDRLGHNQFQVLINQGCAAAGFKDTNFTPYSLRCLFVEMEEENGTSMPKLISKTGHKTYAGAQAYLRLRADDEKDYESNKKMSETLAKLASKKKKSKRETIVIPSSEDDDEDVSQLKSDTQQTVVTTTADQFQIPLSPMRFEGTQISSQLYGELTGYSSASASHSTVAPTVVSPRRVSKRRRVPETVVPQSDGSKRQRLLRYLSQPISLASRRRLQFTSSQSRLSPIISVGHSQDPFARFKKDDSMSPAKGGDSMEKAMPFVNGVMKAASSSGATININFHFH